MVCHAVNCGANRGRVRSASMICSNVMLRLLEWLDQRYERMFAPRTWTPAVAEAELDGGGRLVAGRPAPSLQLSLALDALEGPQVLDLTGVVGVVGRRPDDAHR